MTPDASDIARRLRQTRADMIGTDDEQHYWDCHEAAAEIERLRLTDEERDAIHHVVGDVADITGPVEDTLRGLLERLK
jgi:NAD(P)-dependent dehydrogenase (short-subunit alcohol dehydrogenase family)